MVENNENRGLVTGSYDLSASQTKLLETRGSTDTFFMGDRDKSIPDLYDTDADRLKNENDKLKIDLLEMAACIKEYEKSLAYDMDKKENHPTNDNAQSSLVAERDQALDEVAHIGRAYADLQKRFLRARESIDKFKVVEAKFFDEVAEMHGWLRTQEIQFKKGRQQCESDLITALELASRAKVELVNKLEYHKAENRMMELQLQSLQRQLDEKDNENKELTMICEKFLNKYSDES